MKFPRCLLAISLLAFLMVLACGETQPPPTPQQAQIIPDTIVPSPEPTNTFTPEPTETPLPTPTEKSTSTPTATSTTIPEPTNTLVPTATATMEPTATTVPPTLTPEPTFTPSPVPEPTATAAPTPTPRPLTAIEVFDLISPSIAFIKTPISMGSGVLIEGGYVVTNAHVIWPYRTVSVVFPDGSEFPDAPVLEWDLMADLALLGPLDTDISAVKLVDGEDLIIGSDAFLMGYPGEAEEFPEPTITRGLISRIRQWEPIEMTYFQTDASIAGGQSGGALVSEKGEVIGISGFSFTEAGFGLVSSASDALPRIKALISGVGPSDIGKRRLPSGRGRTEQEFEQINPWDGSVFVFETAEEVDVEIAVEISELGGILVSNMLGDFFPIFNGLSGIGSDEFTTVLEGPYFFTPYVNDGVGSGMVRSNQRLVPFKDPDDQKDIIFGEPVIGNMDYSLDFDAFNIELAEDDLIELTVDSLYFDPVVSIVFVDEDFAPVESDNNTGGGIFGLNPELSYTAPRTGSYLVVVQDAETQGFGGYLLSVIAPDADSQAEAYGQSLTASADVQLSIGETDRAVELYSRAIELAPDLPEAYLGRGRAYDSLEEFDNAVADLGTAIELSSDDDEPLWTRALVLWTQGDSDDAITDLELAKQIEDVSGNTYSISALVQASLGNLDEALSDINTALELQPRDNALIRESRGYIYIKREEYTRALTEYNATREQLSGSPYFELGLGLTYMGLNDANKAIDILEDALKEARTITNPDPQLTDLIAMVDAALDSLEN